MTDCNNSDEELTTGGADLQPEQTLLSDAFVHPKQDKTQRNKAAQAVLVVIAISTNNTNATVTEEVLLLVVVAVVVAILVLVTILTRSY